MPKNKRRSSGKAKKPTRPCTYDLGYVRQDLYYCVKCTSAANNVRSGFCRGCRELCHADHPEDVFELYTKRSFRCDCGNTRAGNVCRLCPQKEDLNIGNEHCYSHNFEGRYCRCNRKYEYALEMAQCAMCEDWFHEECYKTDAHVRSDKGTINGEYELTCKSCVSKLSVLAEYYETLNMWSSSKSVKKTRRGACSRPKNVGMAKPGTLDLLWRPDFRVELCTCNECMGLYKAAKALYIVDRTDFVKPITGEADDSSLLKTTSDEEIINDLLHVDEAQAMEAAREEAMQDSERIPRKPLPPAINAARAGVQDKLSVTEVMSIRRRINDFLRNSIETNGGSLDHDSVMSYLTDLKAEMLGSLNS